VILKLFDRAECVGS